MFQPRGIIAPLVTPFTQDDHIHRVELKKQVNRLINAGVNGIFALGTTGEFYALSEKEKLEVLETVIDETHGRVPVYAGSGCISTSETIALSKKAQELGADALTLISPYYVAVSQEDIFIHFKEIAESIDAPILLYNIPARTGNNIEYTTVKKLCSSCRNIVGIKDSSGNFDNTLRYIEDTDERLAVLSGNDSLILWTLLAGGRGAVAGTVNVFPELVVSIYNAWESQYDY